MTKREREIIAEISRVREKNNRNWMGLLELAMDHAPVAAKRILGEITENDRIISKLSARLANK